MDGKLGDPFFVTGGGSSGIHPIGTEVEAGAGLANDLKSCDTSDHKRPRSTPLPLPSNRGNFFSSGSEEYTLSARRDVRTADDANCLGHRRLCFRSEPIHDLHVATLKTIDPTGIYGMYQEWSNIKNRVLSRGFAEQRSDLALYDRLRKEAEDDKASSDNDASIDNAVVASGTNSMEEAYRTRSPSSVSPPPAAEAIDENESIPPEVVRDGNGIAARRRRRRLKDAHSFEPEGHAANLDYARNLHKEPGLPPLRLLRESSEGALRLAHMALGDRHVMALMSSLDHLPGLTSIDIADNRIGSTAMRTVLAIAEAKGVLHLDLSLNHVDRVSAGLLCKYLTRSSGLVSLLVKSCGMSALASAAIMVAVATNTTLKTLNLSGNNMGGTSDLIASHHHQQRGSAASAAAGVGGSGGEVGGADRLTGGASVALALDSNNSLTYLDLSWNKIGEINAAPIGLALENNHALRWLSLAGNRLGDQGAFSLGEALGVNCSLTHLDVSFNGISCSGAAALGHGLRGNTAIKNFQVGLSTSIYSTLANEPRHRIYFSQGATSQGAALQRNLQLVRPSPDAAVLQPRGIIVNAAEGEGSLQGDVPLEFCARSYSDQQTTLAALSVRVHGEHEAWPLPTKGRLTGLVEFIPLPPCMASVCNATGLRGLLAAMNGCFDTRVEVFRLFVADLFMTTNQVQWLIEQLAGGPNVLNSAEMLKMMAAVSPQLFDNTGLPDLIERNLSPMGRKMLEVQLGQAYPAFTGGVSGPFLLDLRFSRHRLAAVRLAEAENFQTRATVWRHRERTKESKTRSKARRRVLIEERVARSMCYTSCGNGVASGLRDKPTGVLELEFVCLSRPPEGTQPISDRRLARLLNSCGMLDPHYWSEYMRPTSFPVSFVDLIRLLRVKGRGDKRQAKILVLLLRVKNSMLRAARVARPRQGLTGMRCVRYRVGGAASAIVGSTRSTPTLASTVVSATSRSPKKTATCAPAAAATGHDSSVTSPEVGPASGKGDRADGGVSPPEHLDPSRRDETSVRTAAASGAADDSPDKDKHHGSEEQKQVARVTEEELTPVQAAVLAVDKRLKGLLEAGGILRGTTSGRECLQGFPRGTPVWENHCGRVGGRDEGGGGGRRVVGASDVVDDEDVAGGAMGWARKFCESDDGRFPSDESGEGISLGKVLAKHVVRDGDVGLVGTSPPTLLVHGLCIRVRHAESNRVLRVKRHPPASGHGEDNAERHEDEWASVARQGVKGCRLRIGTKKEVASALAATFAGLTKQPNLASTSTSSAATPRTLGTLDMTTDKGWRELFVPPELLVSTAVTEAGPLQLTLLVVNTSPEPNLSQSLAQLRVRLGGSWLSSAQAATVAAVVPRVLGGVHYRVDVAVFLFSRVVDLENYRQVIETLHERKRPQLLLRLGNLDALCPVPALSSAAAATSTKSGTAPITRLSSSA
ncbi:Hypothetical leucine rich repeat protein [Ectocarpus siliculosus]|uniref:Hypothetical leucine rich repeat protein n=1 Tax=Ectocarpus siliculosus TaxID=2880 RepID=D8LKL9_ECTSI|nr:Hypothetical leucine rich repeat protein [Ectocarpus siliculosus]|eukprot:CBN74609.1 Hypothetical leucine rich repeat protein [Ectocarpus siliculosus]